MGRAQDRERLPGAVEVVPDAAFVDGVDGIVSLGGDGTMLGALRLVARRPVPVLGVNHGRLGFLVEVTPPALTDALERLAAGEFTVEHHGCLVADAEGAELTTRLAFNDVVLTRHGRTGTVSVDLAVGGLHYGYYRCDAVVVATPNGSTAYNYAAGGPVVSPSAAAVVVTPVAPMTGIDRAVVLGTGDRIALTVARRQHPGRRGRRRHGRGGSGRRRHRDRALPGGRRAGRAAVGGRPRAPEPDQTQPARPAVAPRPVARAHPSRAAPARAARVAATLRRLTPITPTTAGATLTRA